MGRNGWRRSLARRNETAAALDSLVEFARVHATEEIEAWASKTP